MSDQPVLWSVRVNTRFLPKWEAWVEPWPGRVLKYTFDSAWTEKAARRKSMRRWKKMERRRDHPETMKGTAITRARCI